MSASYWYRERATKNVVLYRHEKVRAASLVVNYRRKRASVMIESKVFRSLSFRGKGFAAILEWADRLVYEAPEMRLRRKLEAWV